MAKKTPVKKSKRRLKRSVRRSLAAVLMITAIGVAAVPVPENYADESGDGGTTPADSYTEVYKAGATVDGVQVGTREDAEGTVVYSLDIYNDSLYWQYKIDSKNSKVIDYNDSYPNTSLTLSESVPTNYTYIKLSEFEEWVNSSDNSFTLTAAGYNTEVAARAFFEKYFADDQEYKDFLAKRTSEDPNEVIASITRSVKNLSDIDQRTYYCDSNTSMNLVGYMLVPIRNQITEQAVLNQIGGDIKTNDVVYIPKYIGTNNTQTSKQDDEGYLLASSGDSITSTQHIERIGNYAFADNGVLVNIELPDWLQEIGVGVFMNCVYLQSVNIPFLKAVPDAAFRNCASLRTVNWWQEGGKSSGLLTVGVEAFYGTGITENMSGQGIIKFPIGVSKISDAAFYGCTSLQRIEFDAPTAGTALTIGQYAFYDNTALTGVAFNNKQVNKLDDYCFAMGVYSNAMSTFTFPNSAFSTGKKILAYRRNLTQIIVPENVVELAGDILEGCESLQVATFQGPTTTYKPELFEYVMTEDFYVTGPARMSTTATKDDVKDASGPRKSTWDAEKTAAGNYIPYLYKIGNKEYYEICSGEGYLESIDKATGTLTSCDVRSDKTTNTNGELVIPDNVGGTDVVKIASGCFKGKTGITNTVRSLVIGNNIRAIEDTVFKSWTNLSEVEIGKSIQTIGKEAFADCPYLTDITFATPDNYQTLASVGANAFATKSGKLTIHGDIVDGYLPFEYAMNPDNYVESSNTVSNTKSRILYQSRWDSPTSKHLSVMYGEYEDGNGYATLVDYPLYQDFYGAGGLSADLEAHNRDMEKQFYNAHGNYTYPSDEDTYVGMKVNFAITYDRDPSSAYNSQYYGPWINPSFCANYKLWLEDTWKAKYGESASNTIFDWLFTPMTVKAADAPDPYFVKYPYDFLKNYRNADGNRSLITVAYKDGWTIDEQEMIEATNRIVIPAGVESIDLKGYYNYKPTTSQQNVAPNQDNYILYFGEGDRCEYSRKGIFVYDVPKEKAGLFCAEIDDLYSASSVSGNDANQGIDQGKHRKGNDRIKVVDMSQSNVVSIPDYAFDDCELLQEVSLPATCATTGKLPFRDCPELKTLTSNSENVPALNGILYQKKDDASYELVECILAKGLDGEGTTITGDVEALNNDAPYINLLSSIAESAFENCQGVKRVDLSGIDNGTNTNKLTSIPDYCFKNCDELLSVVLPQSAYEIGQEAFAYIRERYRYFDPKSETPRLEITIRGSEFNISETAFDPKGKDKKNGDGEESTIGMVTIWTYENTAAERYVLEQQRLGYDIRLGDDRQTYLGTMKRVHFWDWNGDELDTVYLGENEDRIFEEKIPAEVIATVTAANHRPGYQFKGWRGSGGLKIGDQITADEVTYVAQYESDGTMINGQYVVEFRDNINGELISGWGASDDGKYHIDAGTSFMDNSIPTPTPPAIEGFTFLEWSHNWTENVKINSNTMIIALYSADNPSSGSTTNPSGNSSNTSKGSGNTGSSNQSSNTSSSATSTTSSSSGSTSSSSSDSTGVKYTVTVENGSGSGSYDVGATVVITANDPAPGMQFQKWTTESNGVALASVSMSATTFTMPANNVTVTANYVAAATPTSATGNGSNNNNGNTGNGSTRVDITKPGISNKDLATANVNGSTDNFVVKITETDEATNAVREALINKYGSLDNILYYAMDISLYDSTGTVKITNTAGLSVDITIPIPDALVAYGGNNMAGAVINGNQLENLSENFTTINGVPCIRFTATHFSPYTIYVDTGNLTEGMLDVTPKTGDPIHPKWFLSIGLACLSIILFMKKDKAVKVKTA
ncbi:MAG: leucine-rich repeat protein [Lachnospiraceae bacterium]|nr:leucine-rich repeat protein [Lachnospiraceae bacterium]